MFIVSWTLLMVRRLFLLFSVDIVVDGQPPCWSPFVVAIVIVAWLRMLSSFDDIRMLSLFFVNAWLRTLSLVDA